MREFATGLCEVGGCTARSVCATLAEDGGAAGPGPVLGMSGQARLDGIVLDVGGGWCRTVRESGPNGRRTRLARNVFVARRGLILRDAR